LRELRLDRVGMLADEANVEHAGSYHATWGAAIRGGGSAAARRRSGTHSWRRPTHGHSRATADTAGRHHASNAFGTCSIVTVGRRRATATTSKRMGWAWRWWRAMN